MRNPEYLFVGHSFRDFTDNEFLKIRKAMDGMSDDQLLLPNREEMIEYFVAEFSLEPLELMVGETEKSTESARFYQENHFGQSFEVPGLAVTWRITFVGRPDLLHVEPSRRQMNDARAGIMGQNLYISASDTISRLEQTPDIIEKELSKQLENIQVNVGYMNSDVKIFNNGLRTFIERVFADRERTARVIKTALEVMNIPLVKNTDAPSVVPIRRKLVRPEIPTATREKTATIMPEDYTHIIGVIRHVGATFESARETFFKLDEEELRNVILANLNGHYMGLATGETFRAAGKTDISIPFENRAAFIGECKIWGGAKVFDDALGQLISYTTWKDSKNALIFFNKNNKDFTAIQAKISELIPAIPGFVRSNSAHAGEWEFVMRPTGTDDEKTIHVFLFDIQQ